ncbi:MAG: hypothetical protein KDD51_04025 [Bdellovibrionales bacterium]|nr:hypothetical protein [Bdellovibrionales bacterium]
MNIRLSKGSARFRVDDKEVEALANDKTLSETVEFPDQSHLVFGVALREKMDASLSLVREGDRFLLEVSEGELHSLRSRLPSRTGVESEVSGPKGPIKLSFEVDVRR